MKKAVSENSRLSLPSEPSLGLFDNIILAIKSEQEKKQTRHLFFIFLLLMLISLIALPFSWSVLAAQSKESGIYYFLLAALSNMHAFFMLWQDFALSILEALPIIGTALFAINIALLLFSVRLFLYKKGTIFKVLKFKS